MDRAYHYNLGQAFLHVVEQHGERVALAYASGERVTYAELNTLSNGLATHLAALGVAKGDVVCIFSDKSKYALGSMLACIKLGAIYSNLDVRSPPSRIAKMLATCTPRAILHDAIGPALTELIAENDAARVDLTDSTLRAQVVAADGPDVCDMTVSGGHPAYIMFTSGSTGFPKGAVMSHANVLNLVDWGRTTFDVTPEDVFTSVNPIYFDNSVFDFYTSLFSGASLCPFPASLVEESGRLIGAINELGCTIWFSVPSLLVYMLTTKSIGRDDLQAITRFVFGGEGFPKARLAQLHALYGNRAQLINVYGPTECTCICSSHVITEEDVADQSRLAPLGLIAPNFECWIDPQDESDPDTGELLLGGPNVGLGYYNDPERTSASFVQHPAQGSYRSVYYRAGDLVRRDAQGVLHFLGRVDNQIKHMGYRIELEEVEAALQALDYVRQCAVVYKSHAQGLGEIVAFAALDEGSPKRVLADVAGTLPPYMIPRQVNLLNELPTNANGKIDRTALKELLKS